MSSTNVLFHSKPPGGSQAIMCPYVFKSHSGRGTRRTRARKERENISICSLFTSSLSSASPVSTRLSWRFGVQPIIMHHHFTGSHIASPSGSYRGNKRRCSSLVVTKGKQISMWEHFFLQRDPKGIFRIYVKGAVVCFPGICKNSLQLPCRSSFSSEV